MTNGGNEKDARKSSNESPVVKPATIEQATKAFKTPTYVISEATLHIDTRKKDTTPAQKE